MIASTSAAAWRNRVNAAGAVLRRVIGVPDYETYVAHMRDAHPGAPLLSPDEFARERQVDRYSRPGARCC